VPVAKYKQFRLSFWLWRGPLQRRVQTVYDFPEKSWVKSTIYLKGSDPEMTWHGNTRCLVAQDLALPTKVRTLIHEEISLLTVLYFSFRARTPKGLQKDPLS